MTFLLTLLIYTALFVAGSIIQHFSSKFSDAKPGEPNFPTADPTKHLPIVFGTCRVPINVFRFARLRTDPIKIRQNTSLITYKMVTASYAYHMTMMAWLCHGKLDGVLDLIFEGDKLLSRYGSGPVRTAPTTLGVTTPAGPVSYEVPTYATVPGLAGTDGILGGGQQNGTLLTINASDLFGGVDFKTGSGAGGVSGAVRVYNGSGEHVTNAFIQAINDAKILAGHPLYPYTEPAYPDWAYIVFEDTYVGTAPQLPPVEVVCARAPAKLGLGNPFMPMEVAEWGGSNYTFRYGDANVAAVLYELLLNEEYGLGIPRALVDLDSFSSAYHYLNPYEAGKNFGVSMMVDRPDAAEEAITEVLRTIEGVIYLSPTTGLLTLWLLRGNADYADNGAGYGYGSVASLPLIHPGNATMVKWGKSAQSLGTNEVVVEFTNVERDLLKDTVRAQNLAAINAAGRRNPVTVQYPIITGKSLALIVAQRDLRALSQEFERGEIEMNRQGMAFYPGMWARITWPKYGLVDKVVRIGTVAPGTMKNGKVRLTVVEDYWSEELPSYATTVPDPTPVPLQPYRVPSIQELYLANTTTQRVVGLSIADPDGHVTLVEFGVDGVYTAVAYPYVFTIDKPTTGSKIITYRVTYTDIDGSSDTIQGSFDDVPALVTLGDPMLTYKFNGVNVDVSAILPIGATGLRIVSALNTPPSDATVLAGTLDITPPFDYSTAAPTGTNVLYIRALATDGTNNSRIVQLTISAKQSPVSSGTERTIQFPFGNGAAMGIAGDWLAGSPSFPATALRFKVRALKADRTQATIDATFSVKKVRESDGVLVDMVTGPLTMTGASEAIFDASAWADKTLAINDEIVVTLETVANPNSVTSLLATLAVSDDS